MGEESGRRGAVELPADDHVHSEWSWDARAGSMVETCRRAVELGLPSISFTEHADFTPWAVPEDADLPPGGHPWVRDGAFRPPPLDVEGYRACLDACRDRYPQLRLRFGVELSEPHWHRADVRALLDRGPFDRVLAWVHSTSAATGSGLTEVGDAYAWRPPDQVVRDYLLEAARMVEEYADFEVLAHIDYPIRYWPADKPYEPLDFEDEHRHLLERLAAAGKVLEVNTKVPLHPQVLTWWRQVGGQAITFASDAHEPDKLAHGFAEARAIAVAAGFRPGRDPYDLWGVDRAARARRCGAGARVRPGSAGRRGGRGSPGAA